jgi:hypothetical protein
MDTQIQVETLTQMVAPAAAALVEMVEMVVLVLPE